MPEQPIIETIGLRKAYSHMEALRGLNLTVPEGRITGFLGRNGAGKTTTIKALVGMLRPTTGEARVLGLDATDPAASVEIRRRIGIVTEEKELYGDMKVGRLVAFTAAFYPAWRKDLAQRYLARFGLPPERRVKALSRGMRTKLALMLVLCRGAELLILDEPTSGLDPEGADDVLQALVSHVAEDGVSIFFSSHQLSEVEQVADGVVIVDHGRAVVAGALDELQESYRRIRLVFEGEAPAAELKSPGVVRTKSNGRMLEIVASAAGDGLLQEARALGPASIDVAPMTLKDIFLESIRSEA